MLSETVQLPGECILKQVLKFDSGGVHDAGDLLMKEQIFLLSIKVSPKRLLLEHNCCGAKPPILEKIEFFGLTWHNLG